MLVIARRAQTDVAIRSLKVSVTKEMPINRTVLDADSHGSRASLGMTHVLSDFFDILKMPHRNNPVWHFISIGPFFLIIPKILHLIGVESSTVLNI